MARSSWVGWCVAGFGEVRLFMTTTTTALTARQRQILNFIAQFIADWGYSPTVRDVADAFDIQPNAVQQHVDALIHKGALTADTSNGRRLARTWRVAELAQESN